MSWSARLGSALVLLLAALVVLFVGSAACTERLLVGPPDGARVFAPGGIVALAWPGTPGTRWHVQVTAQGRPWLDADVTAPLVPLRAPAGPLYRWRVTTSGGGEAVPWRTFQVFDDPRLDFRGAAGTAGRNGFTAGNAGERGQPGCNGRDLDVCVERVDGWVRVRIETPLGVREAIYLPPSSPPLALLAGGGRGGAGGCGANGMGAVVNTPGGLLVAAGPGAMGGDGGDGGAGATVRLHGPADLERYVTVDISGGDGGRGGLGGGGSIGAPGPGDTVIYGPPGGTGAKGRDGRPGVMGRVIRTP